MQLGWESDKKSGPFAELLLHETSLSAFNLSIHPWLIFRVQCQQLAPSSQRTSKLLLLQENEEEEEAGRMRALDRL
jgi:hypothetical protein